MNLKSKKTTENNTEWYLETLLDEWKRNKNVSSEQLNSFEYLRLAIDFLSEKVSSMSRDLKAWDLYNIKESADTLSEFNEKIGSLQPNSGLVITSTFDVYNKGDIVIKTESGSNIHIKNESSGIYYPSKIEQISVGSQSTPQYKLHFTYSSSIPDVGTVDSLNPESSETKQSKETFILENLQAVENSKDMTYGLIESVIGGQVTFLAIDGVKPIIKLYDNSNQIIECEPKLTLNGGKYTLSNIPNIVKTVVIR